MSESGWETLPYVREWSGAHPYVREWLRGPPGCPGKVRRPSRTFGVGQETLPDVFEWWEALLDVREWLGGPSGHLEVVGRPTRMSGSLYRISGCGRLALSDILESSKDPSRCPGVLERPSRMSLSG